MIEAPINKIETLSLVDGPGIRTVIFFQGCKLRCKFCHNPETWSNQGTTYTIEDLVKKILRSKPYFQKNGGVTFSGGEPLLQSKFIIEVCKKLKEEKIHIALDTAGIGNGDYQELLKYIDLVLLDIKQITKEKYLDITQTNHYHDFLEFVKQLNQSNKEVWIRQVIIPGENDNIQYLKRLAKYLKKIKKISKVEFLPFHTMAFEKYNNLQIPNPFLKKEAMDKEICKELEEQFKLLYYKEKDINK